MKKKDIIIFSVMALWCGLVIWALKNLDNKPEGKLLSIIIVAPFFVTLWILNRENRK